jgi:hypothetical protein
MVTAVTDVIIHRLSDAGAAGGPVRDRRRGSAQEVASTLAGTRGPVAARSEGHRTATAMFVVVGFALSGLPATRVVPPGPPHAHGPTPQPEHLFRHHAGGIA